MTEQEKELGIYIAECVNGLPDSGDNFKDCFTLAKVIIQRYPQITKKPLGAKLGEAPYGNSSVIAGNCYLVVGGAFFFNSNAERQEWIDKHYVEVVE